MAVNRLTFWLFLNDCETKNGPCVDYSFPVQQSAFRRFYRKHGNCPVFEKTRHVFTIKYYSEFKNNSKCNTPMLKNSDYAHHYLKLCLLSHVWQHTNQFTVSAHLVVPTWLRLRASAVFVYCTPCVITSPVKLSSAKFK